MKNYIIHYLSEWAVVIKHWIDYNNNNLSEIYVLVGVPTYDCVSLRLTLKLWRGNIKTEVKE